ncbi:hypothetical protein GQ600_4401 [Phytophthora cactorum]|nr:hypothetical protein GQ600_4401 [Phytophthora cactorum]
MKRMCDPQFATDAMFLKREGDEGLQPKGNEDSTQLQQMLRSFVDYSIPYTTDCRMIHNAMQLALQQERQRDAVVKPSDRGPDTRLEVL